MWDGQMKMPTGTVGGDGRAVPSLAPKLTTAPVPKPLARVGPKPSMQAVADFLCGCMSNGWVWMGGGIWGIASEACFDVRFLRRYFIPLGAYKITSIGIPQDHGAVTSAVINFQV